MFEGSHSGLFGVYLIILIANLGQMAITLLFVGMDFVIIKNNDLLLKETFN